MKHCINIIYIFLLCIICSAIINNKAIAQQSILLINNPDSSSHNNNSHLKADSILLDVKQPKSGNLAMLLSAILPGAGQIYSNRLYTIPIIWGFGYYFFNEYQKANKQYQDYRNRYRDALLNNSLETYRNYYYQYREEWHSFRDEMAVYFVLTYLLNIVDAYVGATLYDFNVSDDLGVTAKLSFKIPLR